MGKAADCYFTFTYGLQGCYMPDAHYGPYHATTRREIAQAIRNVLEMCDASPRRIRDVSLTRLWAQAKQHGTSSIHFCIATDKHNMVEFHGLTEREYNERVAEED